VLLEETDGEDLVLLGQHGKPAVERGDQ
jgi:hypothetical protein